MTDISPLPRYEADPEELRRICSYFPSGVVALLADIDDQTKGMVASAFTVGVSFDPPLVSCAIQNTSSSWPELRTAESVGVSVLAHDQEGLARQISSRDRAARFTGVPVRRTGSSARFIAGAPVWLECRVFGEHPAGDHTIVLLEVVSLGADPALDPLVYHGSRFTGLRLSEGDLR